MLDSFFVTVEFSVSVTRLGVGVRECALRFLPLSLSLSPLSFSSLFDSVLTSFESYVFPSSFVLLFTLELDLVLSLFELLLLVVDDELVLLLEYDDEEVEDEVVFVLVGTLFNADLLPTDDLRFPSEEDLLSVSFSELESDAWFSFEIGL